jgi:hypothetical protein
MEPTAEEKQTTFANENAGEVKSQAASCGDEEFKLRRWVSLFRFSPGVLSGRAVRGLGRALRYLTGHRRFRYGPNAPVGQRKITE